MSRLANPLAAEFAILYKRIIGFVTLYMGIIGFAVLDMSTSVLDI